MQTLALLLTIGQIAVGVPAIAATPSRCTTSRNTLAGAAETHCSDGSTSTTTRNSLTGDLETIIQPGPQRYPSLPYLTPQPRPQRCTTSRSALTRALETLCY